MLSVPLVMINNFHIPSHPLVFFLSLSLFCLTVLISFILKHKQGFLISLALLLCIAMLVIPMINFFGQYKNTIFNAISFIAGLVVIPGTLVVVFFALVQVNNYIFPDKNITAKSVLFFILVPLLSVTYFSLTIVACLNEILLIAKMLRHFVIKIPDYKALKLSETFTPATAIFAFYTTFITYTAKKFFEPYLDKIIKANKSSDQIYSLEELQKFEILNKMKNTHFDKTIMDLEEIKLQINKIKDKSSAKESSQNKKH
ncbi:hypothetical protein LCIT_08430 [Leuconostoc citreum]|uniref:Uncharacterized protein n=1 Tax=Leuconostoc citreum TaxID=33964 RepID=A0A5A5TY27_LEUCI|nr:hypothetical protein [Leuconostoc citreum]GDZ83601.1 hypothetical protein LCIT_08430 [Leuconostoc citreum]